MARFRRGWRASAALAAAAACLCGSCWAHELDGKGEHDSAPPVWGEVYQGGAGSGGFSASGVTLLAHMPLNTIGGGPGILGNDIWGWTDPLTAKEYVLYGRSDGTSFIDVTIPTEPVYLGNLPSHTGTSVWRAIKVYGNRAYIAADRNGAHGLQVFDLAQLRGVTAPATFSEIPGAHYFGVSFVHNIAVNEETGYLYLLGSSASRGGLHILDVRNPVPAFAGDFADDGYTHDAQVVVYRGPDAAYAGREIAFAANEDTLTIVDVTNKTGPTMLSRTGYPERGYAHQGWLTADQRYFLLDDEWDGFPDFGGHVQPTRTHLWNVADLDAPVYLGFYSGTTVANDHNLYIRGRYAFEANYTSGLRVIDLAEIDRGRLREIAFFDTYPADDAPTFNGAWGNYPFFPSGTIVVNDRQNGLFVLRLEVPEPGAAGLTWGAVWLLGTLVFARRGSRRVWRSPLRRHWCSAQANCPVSTLQSTPK
jgi:choice-of-anchor B domain-containing protein